MQIRWRSVPLTRPNIKEVEHPNCLAWLQLGGRSPRKKPYGVYGQLDPGLA